MTISASARRMWDDDTASRTLGLELVEATDGRATLTMTVGSAMVNGHGLAHGGYLFLLADTAFAFACNSDAPATVAAGADVVFVASAFEGDQLVAEAVERTRHGRSGVYDVQVRRPVDGQVIVEFRGRSRTLARQDTSA